MQDRYVHPENREIGGVYVDPQPINDPSGILSSGNYDPSGQSGVRDKNIGAWGYYLGHKQSHGEGE